MLTTQDIKNAQVFLNRVDLKGKEAMAMTDIQIKLNNMLSELERPSQIISPNEDPPED